MKKYLTQKNIAVLSIAFSMVGIIFQVLGIFTQAELNLGFLKSLSILGWFVPINIQPFGGLFRMFTWLSGLNLFFHVLFLIGGLQYLKHPDKEIKLLRFIYALIFALACTGICTTIFWFIIEPRTFAMVAEQHGNKWLYVGLGFLKSAILIYLSFRVLKVLNTSRKLLYTERIISEQVFTKYTEATLGQRFMHLVVDMVMSLLIFGPLVIIMGRPVFSKVQDSLGERTLLYLVILTCRLLYYLFFEGIFNATPSKYLSETKVCHSDGSRISFGTAFVRTLCRHIPFEPFSAFSGNAWHDQFSDSYVYQEQKTEVLKSTYYWWLIPIFILLVAGSPWSVRLLKDYSEKLRYEREYEGKVSYLQRSVAKPSVQQFYLLTKNGDSYAPESFYIKVEKVNGSSIIVSSLKSLSINREHLRDL